MKIEELERLKGQNARTWHHYNTRPSMPPLDWSIVFSSLHKLADIIPPFEISHAKWQDHKCYFDENEVKKISNFIKEKYERDIDFLLDTLIQCEKDYLLYREYAERPSQNLHEYISKIFELQQKVDPYFRFVIAIDLVLQKEANYSFCAPLKKNEIMRFEEELNNLVHQGYTSEAINTVAERYFWIQIFHYTGEFLTGDDVLQRVTTSIKKQSQQLPLAPSDKKTYLHRYITYIRTLMPETKMVVGAHVKRALLSFCARHSISFKELSYCTMDEVLESVKQDKIIIPREEIKSRMARFALFLHNNKTHILNKEECDYVFGPIKRESSQEKECFKGTPAYGGLITGNARIIRNFDDFEKLKENDILVAYSTTPNYIRIMNKASAFITQEGGVTSHAAIVAREMKKPCIVAVPEIMEKLKDGDLIEVDATKGIIKKQ